MGQEVTYGSHNAHHNGKARAHRVGTKFPCRAGRGRRYRGAGGLAARGVERRRCVPGFEPRSGMRRLDDGQHRDPGPGHRLPGGEQLRTFDRPDPDNWDSGYRGNVYWGTGY